MPHKPHLPQDSPKEFRLNIVEGNAHLHVASFLAQRKRFPVPDHFEGTGCVMAAGGRMYLREAFITISRIRAEGWDWPIEIWHLGPKEAPHELRRRFDHLDVRFVDAHQIRRIHPSRQLGGWQLKHYAIAWCQYDNVLLLDADSVPVRDPFPLFDAPEFKEFGAIFWPDIITNRKDDKIFTFLGLSKPDGFVEGESGQIMLSKTRNWRAWELMLWLNDYADFFFKYVHGEKDLGELSFLRTGHGFRMAPPCAWMGWGIEQRWFDGEPLFEHRMARKREPGCFVSEVDRFYWGQFDRFDRITAEQNLAVA